MIEVITLYTDCENSWKFIYGKFKSNDLWHVHSTRYKIKYVIKIQICILFVKYYQKKK